MSDYVDEGIPVDAVYLDIQKAFDRVSHNKLLIKMARYGIDDGVVRWVGNRLSDRKQRVVIEGFASGWEWVLSGIPQGSVLGPVLSLCLSTILMRVSAALCSSLRMTRSW